MMKLASKILFITIWFVHISSALNIPKLLPIKLFKEAQEKLQGIAYKTPLQYMASLSEKYDCNVFFKREDLQIVRSYKIRGAYYKMKTTPKSLLQKGVVAASAGNHAQGVALSCRLLKINCRIFMPKATPMQKINKVRNFGKEFIEIVLVGKNFDEAFSAADQYTLKTDSIFVHPFNDLKVITGQGTVALEILDEIDLPIDYVFGSIGGGGFMSGLSAVFNQLSPETKMVGVEPLGAASMLESFKNGKITRLKEFDPFVDGAAVGKPGKYAFNILRKTLETIIVVPEGKVCKSILELYNDEGMIVEPSGALTVSALDFYKKEIKGKTIVVNISGGNNDINRDEEIKRRSAEYERLSAKENSL